MPKPPAVTLVEQLELEAFDQEAQGRVWTANLLRRAVQKIEDDAKVIAGHMAADRSVSEALNTGDGRYRP